MKNAEILPLWALTDDPLLLRRNTFTADHAAHRHRRVRLVLPPIPKFMIRFIRSYGLIIAAVFFLAVWTVVSCSITASTVKSRTEEAVTIRMEEEMRRRLTAQEITFRAEALMSDGEAMQIADEADAIARAIGPMKTKRMKRSMAWNILTRVDNPAYPNSVSGVLAVPDQWIFYNPSNPIREDDRALALEIVKYWHEGRYPEDLHADDVFGEWSENDYQLRNTLEKGPNTHYWRAPDE